MEVKDRLIRYFGVDNHGELTEHIKNNPTDSKVLMIKELLEEWGVDINGENYKSILGI